MWYKNICSVSFSFVTMHACDRQTDGRTDRQNYDSQDHPRICSHGKKHRRCQLHPIRPEDTPLGPPAKFCMWAKFTDVINCAKFHLHWLSRFSAPEVKKSQFSLCMGDHSYNSVRTNVLHYDTTLGNCLYAQRKGPNVTSTI